MKRSIPFSLLAAFAAAGFAAAEPVYTTPVGYVTTPDIPPNAFSFVGLTIHNSTTVAGVVDSATSVSVTDADVDFTSLLTSGTTYVLELEDGTIQEINSWTATTLTTPDDISASITNNVTKYKLRKAATVADVFGINNTYSLTSTADAIQDADIIYIVGAGGGVTQVYFYDDGSEAAWYTSGGDEAANLPIVYADGFYINRVAGASINLTLSGEVKVNDTAGVINPGWNFLSSVAPAGVTLDNSGLENYITSTDDNYLTVDNVYIPNPGGSFTIAYYYDDGSEAAWYTSGGDEAGALKLEGAFLILSRDLNPKPYKISVPASYINP